MSESYIFSIWSYRDAIFEGLAQAWLLWAAVAFVALLKSGVALYRYLRIRRSGIDEIDNMSGVDFERRLHALFRSLGNEPELTPAGADYGADLIIERDGQRTVVQAKRLAKNVGVSAIQQAVAAKGHYDCAAAMVVTNSYFTAPALKLAAANDVTLWDRDRLIKALNT